MVLSVIDLISDSDVSKSRACVHNQRELLLSLFGKSYYVTVPQAEPVLQMTCWQTLDMRLALNPETGYPASFRNRGSVCASHYQISIPPF